MSTQITTIHAREILSSGSLPTLEVRCKLASGATGIASVAFGASAGSHEAHTLTDNNKNRFFGYGMLKAVKIINGFLAKKLSGKNSLHQRMIDALLIGLDGTPHKKKIGGNTILGVSIAVAKAASVHMKLPLYRYLRTSFALPYKKYILPSPMMVVFEGGKHSDNSLDFQEYLITPTGKKTAKEKIRCGVEIYLTVKTLLLEAKMNTNVGNEGAFGPSNISNVFPLRTILKAIRRAGYAPGKDASISIDAAATQLYYKGKYILRNEKKVFSGEQMIRYFKKWANAFPLKSIEDPFDEDDWDNWQNIQRVMGAKVTIVGDDLTVTNLKRLQKAIRLRAIGAIILKLNQIGTVTETVDCAQEAHKHGIQTIVSHRGGGETNDTSMIDTAVALNAEFIKVGPSRGERVEKYNRLMEIEDEIVSHAHS